MFSNAEKKILYLLGKKENTINNLLVELNKSNEEYNYSTIKKLLEKLKNENMIYQKQKKYYLNNKIRIIDCLTSSENSLDENINNNYSNEEIINEDENIFIKNDQFLNSSENLDEELNITFNKISDFDDGVKFSIDKDEKNNKVVNLNLNLILEISDRNLKQYKPKELELNLKIPKSVYLLISKKLDDN